jgi:hypothetical protein
MCWLNLALGTIHFAILMRMMMVLFLKKKSHAPHTKKGKKDPNTSLVMATVNAKMVVGAEGASLISLVRVPSHQT